MLRTRTQLWRLSLLTSLGLLGSGCGAEVNEVVENTRNGVGGGGSVGGGPVGGEQSMPSVEDCDNPTAVLRSGVDTGLVQCEDGVVHRPEAVQCANTLAARADTRVECFGEEEWCEENSECTVDADCTEQPFGHCQQTGQVILYRCSYGCERDADCGANQACVCGVTIGQCVDTTCQSAEDCGGGLLCARWYDRAGIGCGEPQQLACQTDDDECRVDSDCDDNFSQYCAVGAKGTRQCFSTPNVACGRPFLVEGQARLAPAVQSADYHCLQPLHPDTQSLSPAQRTTLANAWTEIGQMEHASVAAFARFALQLLQLGAPCQLLLDTQKAMADETEHTRLAFSLASAYAGRDIGPGSLPMEGALSDCELGDVLELVIREGCLGETVAALEAAEALAHCEEATVRVVLQTISQDELRHAELAWRFVAWALAKQPSLAARAARVFAEIESAPAAIAPSKASEFNTLIHGVVTESLRTEIRRAAYRDIVGPCARALLATRPQPEHPAEPGRPILDLVAH